MGEQVGAPTFRLPDHRGEPDLLLAERSDLAIDPGEGVADDRPALGLIAARPEPSPVASSGCVVLEQLADLGEAEPRVVAEALDEAQALDVIVVEEPIRALGAGGGLEQADLLVVPDRPRRQAEDGRNLLDAEEWRVRHAGARLGFRVVVIEMAHGTPMIAEPYRSRKGSGSFAASDARAMACRTRARWRCPDAPVNLSITAGE